MQQLLGTGAATPPPHPTAPSPLAPIATAVDNFLAGRRAVAGIVTGLVVTDPTGWTPAGALVDGSAIDAMLTRPHRRWGARPHAAAALTWKAYTYWLAVPVVLGWLTDRRVPLLDADNVLVRLDDDRPQMTIGMRRPLVGVIGAGPETGGRPDSSVVDSPGSVVVDSPSALLALLRATLLDGHLRPLAEQTRRHVRVGERVLMGQLAAAIANLTVAAALTGHASDRSATDEGAALLNALDLADLASVGCRPGGGPCAKRNTCCLAFTVAGLGVCGNCPVPADKR